ncbi:MAG: sigma-54-dependent Fis family transcriptional regulator [Syntrophaceae bacterium]|nr:sigma-54-dependent Fis family transcriptional regulator [Syntrophaceae bacterium]
MNILIVDDELNIRKTLSVCLEMEGHTVVAVSNYRDALSENALRSYDAAFVDLRLGTESGLDLIPALLARSPWLKIIVITAYASVDTAVEAIKRGATDYIPKPFTPAQVNIVVQKVAELRSLEQRIDTLQADLNRINPEVDMTTSSPVMQRALDLARQVAPTDAIVLLTGENGTGKSIFARAIHGWSTRANKPFAEISCPALSAELLESELFGHVKGAFTGAVRDHSGRIAFCEGGTLFLDEIGDLPLSVQPKLLRFIQEREYERLGDHVTRKADVRLIAATNMNLEEAVRNHRFREDLFYRLNVIQIEIPPLRERQDDVVNLARRLLAFFGRSNHKASQRFTENALQFLRRYSWPGNVRELRNVIERASILCNSESVGVEHLPEKLIAAEECPKPGDFASLDTIEETHIRRVLASTRSLQEAADILGIDQATLWRRRKRYNI